MTRRRGSRDTEPHPLAPLATQDPTDQLDGVEDRTEEEEQEVMRISPRSDSPRGWFNMLMIALIVVMLW